MKVTDDAFYRGLVANPVFGVAISWGAADRILAGIGTDYEPQNYSEEERRWACSVLGKPFNKRTK